MRAVVPWARASILAAGLAALAASASPAAASDYQSTCSSADGAYLMVDDLLTASYDPATPEIAYRTLERTVLRRREGYCTSRESGETRHPYLAESALIRIEADLGGGPAELTLYCELYASGLPAAYSCDVEAVTEDFDRLAE